MCRHLFIRGSLVHGNETGHIETVLIVCAVDPCFSVDVPLFPNSLPSPQNKCGVKINAPSKQECNSGAAFVIVTITQLQAASNMQGAIQFIQSKAPGATPAGGGGAAAAGGGLFGGGAAGGGGGAAAGNTCIFMFRNNPKTTNSRSAFSNKGTVGMYRVAMVSEENC